MRTNLISVLSLLGLAACSSSQTPQVSVEILPPDPSNPRCIERITVSGTDSIEKLCFNQLPRPFELLNESDTLTEINAGYYALTSPKFGDGSSVSFDIVCDWPIRVEAELPESFHAVTPSGRIIQVDYKTQPIFEAAYADSTWTAWMQSPEEVYDINQRLSEGKQPGPFDVVPSFKSVTLKEGSFNDESPVRTSLIKHENPEYYRITLSPSEALIEGASANAVKMAKRVLENRLLASGGELPCAVIEDWPDFPYRAVMIDIARNFMNPLEMRKIVSNLADYRLNTLHFHITDDEAWRLEIPGLPELTEVGSRRGYTLDDSSFLKQIFSGNGDPDSKEGTANGYFSRQDFILFLQFCDSLGIQVVPEIESPGHARAAIKSMEARLRNTGDDTYRLIIPGDTSRYTSAQLYHDNLMNPAAPGTYRFISKVVDEVAKMYQEAGVPLPGIHLGGDEVPDGAWDGCHQTLEWAAERGASGRHGIQGEYVREIAKIMRDRKIPLFGWQDICTDYSPEFHAEVAPAIGGVNCWVSSHDPEKNIAIKGVNAGYPVILSNVDYFYLDMLYSKNPEERGLYWGGIVDELQALSGYADTICPPQQNAKGRIIGVSGQLFGETLRSLEGAENLIFPKVLGLAERGWNSKKTYSDEDFNMLIGSKELPRLSANGVNAHIRRPGIKIAGGKVYMNSPYPDAEIRYTLDGSVPSESSPRYEEPIALPSDTREVRAVLFKNGLSSPSTLKKVEG